jgi:hypothetical protein
MSGNPISPWPLLTGTVDLDGNSSGAYLVWGGNQDHPGGTCLMVYDPKATGNGSVQGAFALYQNKDGQQVVFYGFPQKDQNGSTVLHVVTPA